MNGFKLDIDLIDTPVVVIDDGMNVVSLNRSARRIYGVSGSAAFDGISCYAMSHDFAEPCTAHDGHPCPMDALKNAGHGETAAALHVHKTASGRRYFAVHITKDAESGNYIEVQSDVTEYIIGFVKHMETITDGIMMTDITGAVLFANRAFITAFGSAASGIDTEPAMIELIRSAAADTDAARIALAVDEHGIIDGADLALSSGRTMQIHRRPIHVSGCAAGALWQVRDTSGEEVLRRDLAEYSDQLERIARFSPAAIILVQEGTIAYANHAASTLFGARLNDVLGMNPEELVISEEASPDNPLVFRENEDQVNCQVRIMAKDGTRRWVDLTSSVTTLAGRAATLFTLFDLSPYKAIEQRLRQSEEMFKALAENLLVGMFLYREKFIYANPKMTELTGYARDELLKRSPREFLPAGILDVVDFDAAYRDTATPKGANYRELELKTRHGDTRTVHLYTNIIPYRDGYAGIGNLIDVTEMIMLRDELERAATIDNLTGVLNRRHFEDIIGKAIPTSQRYGHDLSLIMFDIDHFKQVNDTLGHQAGDSVLVDIGHVVGRRIRDADSFCRWGGEEFMLALPNTPFDAAVALAEDIRGLIEKEVTAGNKPVTASFGVTCCSRFDTVESITARVDAAMYAAKQSGRNQVRSESCTE